MDATALRLLLPKLPLILKTALLHTLGATPTSTKWDLRTELTIVVLRAFLGAPGGTRTLEQVQRATIKDVPVKPGMWVARVTLPPPEEAVRTAVYAAIDALKEGGEAVDEAALAPVEAEWTGHRAAAGTQPADMSEEARYGALMQDASSDVTVLYFHGGAYYLCDPATHRSTTARLARLTKGRVLSVRYRLAPQHPFPAALLDALGAYIALLRPPPGALHAPVDPKHIVLAGDSAGGNLALALTLLLLQLNRAAAPLPLPAGVAVNSPWTDLTHSMPSTRAALAAMYDYLVMGDGPATRYKASAAWPARPPRADLYAAGEALRHPLVSPLAAAETLWEGAPPLWACTGQERLEDEGRALAARVARANGARVRWEGFEAMPHCFALVLETLRPGGDRCFEGWARFCREVVEGGEVRFGGCWVEAKTGQETEMPLREVSALSDAEIEAAMREYQQKKVDAFEAFLRTREAGELGHANGSAKL